MHNHQTPMLTDLHRADLLRDAEKARAAQSLRDEHNAQPPMQAIQTPVIAPLMRRIGTALRAAGETLESRFEPAMQPDHCPDAQPSC